jgi:SNF2 family DNA or RNA helicase
LKARQFVIDNPRCALFLDMGLGKTATVLSAILHLLTETTELQSILIVGPKRVVEQTWPDELEKWEQFAPLQYSVIAGTPAQRQAAIKRSAHIYLVSRDNLAWLMLQPHPQYDMLVLDELSSFKNSQSKRFKALKFKAKAFRRVVGLTGTPAPNGLMDLWSQIYLLDGGKRLGPNISTYRATYFNSFSYGAFPEYTPRPEAQRIITESISDICISMTAKDYLDLPDLIPIEHKIHPTTIVEGLYSRLKKDLVLSIQDSTITAVNAAVLAGKLLQFCGGTVYAEDKTPTQIHELKLDALEEIIEAQLGASTLVYYAYQTERDAILQRFGKKVTEVRSEGSIEKWNNHDVPILLAHPASAGHGLNLQHGGNTIVWYNLTYDLELYLQANKRLHRMGQTKPVTIHHLTLNNCIDSQILNTVLKQKGRLQDALTEALTFDKKCA